MPLASCMEERLGLAEHWPVLLAHPRPGPTGGQSSNLYYSPAVKLAVKGWRTGGAEQLHDLTEDEIA